MQIIPLNQRYEGQTLADIFTRVCVEAWCEEKKLNNKLAASLIHEIGVSQGNLSLAHAILDISAAADGDNVRANPYHNPLHSAQVAMMAAYFCAQDGTMNERDRLITLASAFAHDLRHPGKGNPENDNAYNERQSTLLAEKIMQSCGVDVDAIADMKAIVISTSPNGPHTFAKNGAVAEQPAVPEQERLVANDRLLKMAQIVCDADIFQSAGINLDMCQSVAKNLTSEMAQAGVDLNFNTTQSRLYFLEHVVGKDGFASPIAKSLANANFKNIYAQTLKMVG